MLKGVPIMPRDLILNSLEIQRFRCFRELRIERLGRVNLIVGKNNVGKSTLLEALRLFATAASPTDLLEILVSRDEVVATTNDGNTDDDIVPVQSLFFGRRETLGPNEVIKIGAIDLPDECLQLFLMSVHELINSLRVDSAKFLNGRFDEQQVFLSARIDSKVRVISGGPTLYRIHEDVGAPAESSVRLEPISAPLRSIQLQRVGSNGLGSEGIGRLWDRISLSPLEQEVIAALKIVSADVQRIALRMPDGMPKAKITYHGSDNRVPFVKIANFEEPIPLRALGDGVNRLFGLALALVNAKGGLLLVDEIENGIHYSVQADLWRLIFETAARLNVQVFATTHSYDCIKAFEEAARESEEEGILVRLARKGDRTLVGEFDERELEIAVEGEIEVR
jgi:ABC-type branched-subunit amino acid transport system ATPase component